MSTSYFVAADWLIEHSNDPEVQILDARMAPPGQEHRDISAEYRAGHLPGAVFFDIEALSDHTSPLPHMLPRPEAFSVAMRELGISRDKHLVVYDEGNLFSAPRAWWMLKNYGVEKVSILAGGLAGWQRDELPLQQGNVTLPEGDFDAQVESSNVKRLTDVLLVSHEKTAQLTRLN
jgi:thiosulfate/3-mercaptopyruvate sulfurtransferase